MTQITLSLLIGAFCASSWWAASLWPHLGSGAIYIPAIFSSLLAVAIIASQTVDRWDR